VLLLTANEDLAESTTELFGLDGLDVATTADAQPVQAVVADLDDWPAGWSWRSDCSRTSSD
jgi:hypothetical protein